TVKASMHPPPIPDLSSPRCCRRHRRNSDVTAESILSNHSANGNGKPVSQRVDGADCRRQATFSSFSHQRRDMTGDSGEALNGVSSVHAAGAMRDSHMPIGSADSLSVERKGGNRHHNLSRKHSVPFHRSSGASSGNDKGGEPSSGGVPSSKETPCEAMRAVGASFIDAIKRNTHDEPMSSTKALRIFNTVFPAMHKQQEQYTLRAGAPMPEHDASCGQCVSEAM
ncbi:hypothetical protein FBU31_008029, partial [Coemansia sp. 'formosensis']